MKKLQSSWFLGLLAGLITTAFTVSAAEFKKADAISLFNGKDLSGWVGVNEVTFEVKDSNMRLVKGMGWLRTEKEFKDFSLEFECRALVEKYDSGIFIRAGLDGKPWPDASWQVNLRYDSLGCFVQRYTTLNKAKAPMVPVNEWMKVRIDVKGTKASAWINGQKIWDVDGLDRPSGYIGIQAEDRAFDFRNFKLAEL